MQSVLSYFLNYFSTVRKEMLSNAIHCFNTFGNSVVMNTNLIQLIFQFQQLRALWGKLMSTLLGVILDLESFIILK